MEQCDLCAWHSPLRQAGSPLFAAVHREDTAGVERALARGADVNERSQVRELSAPGRPALLCAQEHGTALHLAVSKECEDIVKRLLQHEADVNARTKARRVGFYCLYAKPALLAQNGLTPLHCAALVGSLSLCHLLIKHGAALSPCTEVRLLTVGARPHELTRRLLTIAQDNALTPLHGSALRGSASLLQLLLMHGASVTETTKVWHALAPGMRLFDCDEHRMGGRHFTSLAMWGTWMLRRCCLLAA